jgi:hypothetical protein
MRLLGARQCYLTLLASLLFYGMSGQCIPPLCVIFLLCVGEDRTMFFVKGAYEMLTNGVICMLYSFMLHQNLLHLVHL